VAERPGVSEVNATVAPNCGIPPESRTIPVSLPALGEGLAALCAATRGALEVTPRVETKKTPKHRRVPCFTPLPPRCDVRRGLLLGRCFHRKLRRARNRDIRQQVCRVDLERILPRGQ